MWLTTNLSFQIGKKWSDPDRSQNSVGFRNPEIQSTPEAHNARGRVRGRPSSAYVS